MSSNPSFQTALKLPDSCLLIRPKNRFITGDDMADQSLVHFVRLKELGNEFCFTIRPISISSASYALFILKRSFKGNTTLILQRHV